MKGVSDVDWGVGVTHVGVTNVEYHIRVTRVLPCRSHQCRERYWNHVLCRLSCWSYMWSDMSSLEAEVTNLDFMLESPMHSRMLGSQMWSIILESHLWSRMLGSQMRSFVAGLTMCMCKLVYNIGETDLK